MLLRLGRPSRVGGGLGATAVDLVGLSVDAALPPALAFQRDAFRVIEAVRASARADRLTTTFAGTPFEVLDLLLFDVVRAAGAGVGAAQLLSTVRVTGATGEGPTVLTLPVAAPELAVAARVVNDRQDAVRFDLPDRRATELRRLLFGLKHRARLLAGAHRAGEVPPAEIVATAQLPSHVHDTAAVLTRLRDEGRTVGFVVADERTAAAVTDAGFAVVGGLDLSRADAARAVTQAFVLRRRVRRAIDRLGDDLTTQAAGGAIDRVLAAHLHPALAFAASVAPALDAAGTRVVLTPNPASIAGRTTSRLAGRRGVPVVGLEHGSIFPDDPRWHDLPVTTMCVWGDTSRRALLASGVADAAIAVTGAARFDEAEPAGAPRRDAGPDPSRTVLVATSGPGDHVSLDTHLRFIDALDHAVAAAPSTARWVVKLHPKDDPRLYDRVAARPSVDVVGADRAGRSSIYDHLRAAACLVTVSSTTAIDALRVGVPVLAVWTSDSEPPPPFVARSSARVVADAASLAAGVADALDGHLTPADPAFLAEYFAHPGEATERICAEVRRHLSRPTRP